MTEQEFVVAIAPLVTIVGKPMSKEMLEAWFLMVGDLEPADLRRAVVVTMREYQYAGFPPVGLVRKNAGASQGTLQSTDRATVAWSAIKSAIATVGGYRSVQFDDPIVTASIRALGGWARFCDCESGEKFDVWLRKEFEATYRAMVVTGVDADQAAPLAGIIEADRSAHGYGLEAGVPLLTEQVSTRLPALPGTAVRGAIEQRRTIAITGPDREYVESLGVELSIPEETSDDDGMNKRRAMLELEVLQLKKEHGSFVLPEAISDPKQKPFSVKGNTNVGSAVYDNGAGDDASDSGSAEAQSADRIERHGEADRPRLRVS